MLIQLLYKLVTTPLYVSTPRASLFFLFSPCLQAVFPGAIVTLQFQTKQKGQQGQKGKRKKKSDFGSNSHKNPQDDSRSKWPF